MRESWRPQRVRRPLSAVTILLIANFVAFVIEISARGPVEYYASLHVKGLLSGFIWQPVTYMFLHDPNSIWHIAFNMFALWMFGRPVEQMLGKRRFYTLYFLSGVVGGLAWLPWEIMFPGSSPAHLVGASGAILGILAACATLTPNMTVLVFFFLPMKMRTFAIVFAIFSVVMQVTGGEGHVAHLAHLGGMLAGWLYVRATMRRRRGGGDVLGRLVNWAKDQRHGGRRVGGNGPPRGPADVGLEFVEDDDLDVGDALSQVDPILDKISRQGMKSLTRRELKILDRAKEQLRNEGR